MKSTDQSCWERITKVIEYSGHKSIKSFSESLGIKRCETLYQIKRGNNGISMAMAKKINARYPTFNLGWLVFGESSGYSLNQNNVTKIPVYMMLPEHLNEPWGVPDYNLHISKAWANGAAFATPFADGMLNPYFGNSLVLLRECKEIIYGNIYLVKTSNFTLFRVLRQTSSEDEICLTSVQEDRESGISHNEVSKRYADIVVKCEDIRHLWVVCGAVCNMLR